MNFNQLINKINEDFKDLFITVDNFILTKNENEKEISFEIIPKFQKDVFGYINEFVNFKIEVKTKIKNNENIYYIIKKEINKNTYKICYYYSDLIDEFDNFDFVNKQYNKVNVL